MWSPRSGGIEAVSRLGDSDVFVDTSIVPLLGVFGIVYDSLAENVIDDSEAESLLEAIVSSEEDSLPNVGLREVGDWFDRQTGRLLFD
jgi:hypothetical protein